MRSLRRRAVICTHRFAYPRREHHRAVTRRLADLTVRTTSSYAISIVPYLYAQHRLPRHLVATLRRLCASAIGPSCRSSSSRAPFAERSRPLRPQPLPLQGRCTHTRADSLRLSQPSLQTSNRCTYRAVVHTHEPIPFAHRSRHLELRTVAPTEPCSYAPVNFPC